ncbi:transposable element Tcb1 transposase [Trichonephila clavipes]|nr:transposable element Tcb1 transposase [Trichonephila clavipes]
MSSHHHIDDFMRGRIIGNIEEGRKITDVAREFDIAHSVVSRLWKSFKTTGMCSRRHGGGRVRSTTPAEDRYIVLSAKRNRRTAAQQSLYICNIILIQSSTFTLHKLNVFTALSTETHPSVLETITFSCIPPTIASYLSQSSKPHKKCPPKNTSNTIKSKIEIKMAPHKPRKSAPIENSVDEVDMIVYDVEEEVESLKNCNYCGETKKDKYFLSEEYWQNEGWKH